MSVKRTWTSFVLGLSLTASASQAAAAPIFFGATPYLSSADIPLGFFSGPFSLEDFEDGTVDFGITPGGNAASILAPSVVTDSVDADDGVIDGSGQTGNPLRGFSYVANGTPGVTFTFTGPLPTAAAVVWTDGASPIDLAYPHSPYPTGPYADNVTFEAFGPGMVSLGTWTFQLGNGLQSYYGDTGEDRFLGVQDAGGILALRVVNPGGQVETDHVMFGTAGTGQPSVPEPATLGLLSLGGLFTLARRRPHKRT